MACACDKPGAFIPSSHPITWLQRDKVPPSYDKCLDPQSILPWRGQSFDLATKYKGRLEITDLARKGWAVKDGNGAEEWSDFGELNRPPKRISDALNCWQILGGIENMGFRALSKIDFNQNNLLVAG